MGPCLLGHMVVVGLVYQFSRRGTVLHPTHRLGGVHIVTAVWWRPFLLAILTGVYCYITVVLIAFS